MKVVAVFVAKAGIEIRIFARNAMAPADRARLLAKLNAETAKCSTLNAAADVAAIELAAWPGVDEFEIRRTGGL